MANDKMKIGEISKPRFEFRTFGQDFTDAEKLMARLSVPVPKKLWHRTSSELYIMSRINNINNTKIRAGKMDTKTYVQTVDGLEQWNPLLKSEFPVKTSVLENDIFPAFQVPMPVLKKGEYKLEEYLNILSDIPELQIVKVHKERFAYMVNNTICEFGNILINGAKVKTINSESTEIDDIKKTLHDVGLEEFENINYLQAIKRVIGMINKPLAN